MTSKASALPRSARLSSASDYRRVFAEATISGDSYFRVLARLNQRDRSRLGLAVSKKRIPKATTRNLLKRLIRERFRLRLEHHQPSAAAPPRDYVVLPRPSAASICKKELAASLDRHWRRIDHKLTEPARGATGD